MYPYILLLFYIFMCYNFLYVFYFIFLFEGVLKMSALLRILMEMDSERTVELIKFSSIFLLLIIGITICACSFNYKGFKVGTVFTFFLLIFLAWLSYNSVSSVILDFIFYHKLYL